MSNIERKIKHTDVEQRYSVAYFDYNIVNKRFNSLKSIDYFFAQEDIESPLPTDRLFLIFEKLKKHAFIEGYKAAAHSLYCAPD